MNCNICEQNMCVCETITPGYALRAALQSTIDIKKLAEQFNVSELMMAKRLNDYFNLGAKID